MNNLPSDFISPALQMEHRLQLIETRLAALEAPAPASVDTPFSLQEHLLNFFGRTLSADEKPHRDGWTGDMLMDPDGTFWRPLLKGERLEAGDMWLNDTGWQAFAESSSIKGYTASHDWWSLRTRRPLPPLQDVADPQTVTVNNPPCCHSSPPKGCGITHPIHCAKEPGHTGMCQSGFFSWANPNEDVAEHPADPFTLWWTNWCQTPSPGGHTIQSSMREAWEAGHNAASNCKVLREDRNQLEAEKHKAQVEAANLKEEVARLQDRVDRQSKGFYEMGNALGCEVTTIEELCKQAREIRLELVALRNKLEPMKSLLQDIVTWHAALKVVDMSGMLERAKQLLA